LPKNVKLKNFKKGKIKSNKNSNNIFSKTLISTLKDNEYLTKVKKKKIKKIVLYYNNTNMIILRVGWLKHL